MPNKKVERFVILSAPRSGSNMLCTMLQSHPDILCHHEIFNPNGLFYALPLRTSEFSLADGIQHRDAQPLRCLSRLWQSNLGHKAVGFKMTHCQNQTVFSHLLHDSGIKKIILERRNQLKVHVSKLIAEQSGVWEDYSTLPPHARCQVKVDIEQLQTDIALNQSYYQQIRDTLHLCGQDWCEVEYEAINTPSQRRLMLEFLNLDNVPLVAQSRKQTPKDLSEVIVNYQELLRCEEPALRSQLTSLDG
ncbi:sulfotransferase [Pseudoalteromonas sp. MMG022]|uniref:sulfotransferase n=1 Tax=Pseudoalteromonas sp. MMG022 TaxID=2909978 RepID=UPI001F27472B|nr:sulfotransferase [Pseudoalteromonas sp. MMG022]MCF6436109.1 sulfotransferase [Pseudoalteromonas sp. MMG022]